MSLKCRSSRSKMFFKIGVLKDIASFTGKKPVFESLLNKVVGLQALLKRDSSAGAFLWSLWNFQEHLGRCFWKFENFFFAFLLSWKDALATRLATKIILHLVYFHSCSFATGMAKMSSSIFIRNALLKNPTERNA